MNTLTHADESARAFFQDYRDALLSRDVERIADSYHCDVLIAFPDQIRAVTDPSQTREFFKNAIGQYDGVEEAIPSITVMGATEHSIWADVSWDYGGAAPAERLVYQLLRTARGWRIGVLTPR
ncbi:nuclear transport factor 2 family protein [Streptosporangium sp. NPDC023963]|uniref:nuclear transport factor 2 family protein n=1 Tax=Streptosporangium sp. NPDC023963 TaxID=3155608 RepID=UPI00342A506A